MAKSKHPSISDLIKGNKKAAPKLTIEEINQAAKNIKSSTETSSLSAEQKKETKRLSIDTPKDLYLKLKAKVAAHDTTVRNYIIELMRKDLE